MFEIDVKPRIVTLQEHRRTKIDKDTWKWEWIDVREYVSDSPFTDRELAELLSSYIAHNFNYENITVTQFGHTLDSASVNGVRFITSKGNQLICDKSIDFLRKFDRASLAIMQVDNRTLLFGDDNPVLAPLVDLQMLILNRKGIKNVRAYPITQTDHYVDCYNVKFNDGTEATVSFWVPNYRQ